MISTEFAPRKIRRKLRADGAVDTATKAVDLFTRKRIGRRIFDPLVEGGIVDTVSREETIRRAASSVQLCDEATSGVSPFVAQFERGYVLTETGLSTTADFEILEESAATPEQAPQAMMAMASREFFIGHLPVLSLLRGRSTATPPILGTVAPLIPRYPNYYHWMVETVPKVRYLREFEDQTGVDVTLLLPADAPGFVGETLDLLGWPESARVRVRNPIYEVRNYLLPSFPERTRADFDWLRGEILEAVLPSNTVSTEDANNVYVSRANAIERRVVNEDEVMDVLGEYGFERYHLENRSLVENVQLFNGADIVVGPHGAGLTDIIFAEDCTLLELFGEKIKEPYELLAGTLGVDYEAMYCRPDSTDLIVDTDELAERVESIFDGER